MSNMLTQKWYPLLLDVPEPRREACAVALEVEHIDLLRRQKNGLTGGALLKALKIFPKIARSYCE